MYYTYKDRNRTLNIAPGIEVRISWHEEEYPVRSERVSTAKMGGSWTEIYLKVAVLINGAVIDTAVTGGVDFYYYPDDISGYSAKEQEAYLREIEDDVVYEVLSGVMPIIENMLEQMSEALTAIRSIGIETLLNTAQQLL